jgi:hypothetical protein
MAQWQRRGERDPFSIMHHFWQITSACKLLSLCLALISQGCANALRKGQTEDWSVPISVLPHFRTFLHYIVIDRC